MVMMTVRTFVDLKNTIQKKPILVWDHYMIQNQTIFTKNYASGDDLNEMNEIKDDSNKQYLSEDDVYEEDSSDND